MNVGICENCSLWKLNDMTKRMNLYLSKLIINTCFCFQHLIRVVGEYCGLQSVDCAGTLHNEVIGKFLW